MPMNYGVIINNHLFLKTNPTYYDSSERSFSYYRYYATPVRKIFDCELEHKDFNFSDETQVVINKEDNSFQAHVPPSKLTLGDQSVCVFGYTAPETYHVRKFSNLLNLKLDDADISYVGVVDQAIDHPSL